MSCKVKYAPIFVTLDDFSGKPIAASYAYAFDDNGHVVTDEAGTAIKFMPYTPLTAADVAHFDDPTPATRPDFKGRIQDDFARNFASECHCPNSELIHVWRNSHYIPRSLQDIARQVSPLATTGLQPITRTEQLAPNTSAAPSINLCKVSLLRGNRVSATV